MVSSFYHFKQFRFRMLLFQFFMGNFYVYYFKVEKYRIPCKNFDIISASFERETNFGLEMTFCYRMSISLLGLKEEL
jgi:hypothetical protein